MGKFPFNNIKVALDTNIVSYLLDDTYENLTLFIQKLNSYDFVEIQCSKFVIYELIEIRKLEHYLRKINENAVERGKTVNFSSALNYRKKWNAPELEYKDCFKEVTREVESELNRLTDEFEIELSDGCLHRDIWRPHQDLVLSSKISKEDSMALISSVFPDIGQSEEYLIFLTNDQDFHKGYCGKETLPKKDGSGADFDIEAVFNSYSIKKPMVEILNNLRTPLSDKPLNVIKGEDTEQQIEDYVSLFLFEHIALCNSKYFLGKVIPCQMAVKTNMLCFKLQVDVLKKYSYFSILTKDLEIINIPKCNSNFWAHGEISNYPYVPDENFKSREISIKLVDENANPILTEEDLNKLAVNGNLVFVHPDSYIDED